MGNPHNTWGFYPNHFTPLSLPWCVSRIQGKWSVGVYGAKPKPMPTQESKLDLPILDLNKLSTNVKLRKLLRFGQHLTFQPLPNPYQTLIRRFETSLKLTWPSHDHLTINLHSPDPCLTLISSCKLKKSYMVGGPARACANAGLILGTSHFGLRLVNIAICSCSVGKSENILEVKSFFMAQIILWN